MRRGRGKSVDMTPSTVLESSAKRLLVMRKQGKMPDPPGSYSHSCLFAATASHGGLPPASIGVPCVHHGPRQCIAVRATAGVQALHQAHHARIPH
eukprot:SAG25_NODE_67_length_17436_cov_89.239257_6_plen_95_part_00